MVEIGDYNLRLAQILSTKPEVHVQEDCNHSRPYIAELEGGVGG